MGCLYFEWHAGFYSSVVVDNITPSYYAPGIPVGEFVIQGSDFSIIPDDAVFVVASNNNAQLYRRYTTNEFYYGVIGPHSDTEIRSAPAGYSSHNFPSYVGAILSADRSIVYWVNYSRPLP